MHLDCLLCTRSIVLLGDLCVMHRDLPTQASTGGALLYLSEAKVIQMGLENPSLDSSDSDCHPTWLGTGPNKQKKLVGVKDSREFVQLLC